MNKIFNPYMLNLARRARGKSQQKLKEMLENTISQAELSKIECGFIRPEEKLIEQLAKVLNFQPAFFYDSCRPRSSIVSFSRKRRTISKKILDTLDAELEIDTKNISKSWKAMKSSRDLPFVDLNEYKGTAAHVAKALRAKWQVPFGPIDDMVDLVESAGVVVVDKNFGTSLLNGLASYSSNDTVPHIIFMNSVQPKDCYRFSLAKELGHLIMHRVPYPEAEKEACSFAAEFLMPEKQIKYSLHSLSMRKLGELKLHWKTSMRSIIRHAYDTKVISEGMYKYYNTQLGKNGYKKTEPIEIQAKESPTLLKLIKILQ